MEEKWRDKEKERQIVKKRNTINERIRGRETIKESKQCCRTDREVATKRENKKAETKGRDQETKGKRQVV